MGLMFIFPAPPPPPAGAGVRIRAGGRRRRGRLQQARYEAQVRDAMLLWADHLRSTIDGDDVKVVPMRMPA